MMEEAGRSGLEGDELDRSSERRMLALLAVLCGVLIAVGASMPLFAGSKTRPAPLVLDGMAEAHIVEIRDHRGQTVLSGEFRSRLDGLGNTEKDAALTDRRGRSVIGEVEIELPAASRADRRAELEVDIMGLPANAAFGIVIDDQTVATFSTDDRGSVDMEVQEGEVPSPRRPVVHQRQVIPSATRFAPRGPSSLAAAGRLPQPH